MRACTLLLLLVAVTMIVRSSTGYVLSGSLSANGPTQYLGTFCFDASPTTPGRIAGSVLTRNPAQSVIIANTTIGGSVTACQMAEQAAEMVFNFSIPESAAFAEDYVITGLHDVYLYSTSCVFPIDITYELTLVNPGGFFSNQFTCYEFGLLPSFLAITLIVATLTTTYCIKWATKPGVDTRASFIKSITIVVSGQALSVGCIFAHLFFYAVDGSGALIVKWFGLGANSLVQVGIMTIGLGIVHGWTRHVIGDRRPAIGILAVVSIAELVVLIIAAADVADSVGLAHSLHTAGGASMFLLSRIGFFAALLLVGIRTLRLSDTTAAHADTLRLFMAAFGLWLMFGVIVGIIAAAGPGRTWRPWVTSLYELQSVLGIAVLIRFIHYGEKNALFSTMSETPNEPLYEAMDRTYDL